MRPTGGAQCVVGVVHVGNPIAKGFVDGIFKRLAALGYRHYCGPHLLHPENVRPLARNIVCAHVDGAVKTKLGGHGGGGNPVLPGTGFSDNASLAHAFGQEPLPHHVVGLVRASVVKIFALDVNTRTTQLIADVIQPGDGRGAAGVSRHQLEIFIPERRIISGFQVGGLQLIEGGDQYLGDEGPAKLAVVTAVFHAFLNSVAAAVLVRAG